MSYTAHFVFINIQTVLIFILSSYFSAQQSLKENYFTRFKTINPFSLPFTFDIENTWVSLALKEEKKSSQAIEDHAVLLQRAFEKVKMLVIEGDPATGKTSLMRRLAYEWAKGKQELLHYDLVLYAEFREVREKTFKSIADMVLGGLERYLTKEDYENIKKLVNNGQFCKKYDILVLLDGYDESSLENQCSEFSLFMTEKMIDKHLIFNTITTTRKGYLSNLRGRKGRFVFAEVLGFTTKQQKEKYIRNHFFSSEIDNRRNIAAVHSLLNNNENLDKLAETPLFLTFICLVHERIVDGTLVELYCNIIRWLIDRHQQDFPDRDVPALFEYGCEFEQASEPLNIREKQITIQNHYLQFPQLLLLGKMALNYLEKNIFHETDFIEFNIKAIIHQVGLIRKDEFYDQLLYLTSTFSFPQRTIHEFVAACYCFCSNDATSKWLLPNSELDTSEYGMKEFERFLLRISLSNKMPIHTEKRRYYFERIAYIKLGITFDAFNSLDSFNNGLLNWFLSQCINVQSIRLWGTRNNVCHASNMLIDTYINNKLDITSKTSSPILFSFSDLTKLHSLTFNKCTFEDNSKLSFTNCPSLKNLQFERCEIKSTTNLGIVTLPAVHTVEFYECTISLATWQTITDEIRNSSVKCLKLDFGDNFTKEFLIHLQNYNNIEKMEITIWYYTIRQTDLFSISELKKLYSLSFWKCTFEANSHLSFKNCHSLENLEFMQCEIKSSTNLGITTLPAIDNVEFHKCNIHLTALQSVTDEIKNSSIKCLKLEFGKDFNKEFLINLQECNNIEEMEITFGNYNIRQNDLLSFSGLMKLHSLAFCMCTFETNSKLLFTECPSLKSLKFDQCELESSTIFGIAALTAIHAVVFSRCKTDLATWLSITIQIRDSNVKYLKLEFGKDFNKEFLIHLQKCSNIEEIEITFGDYNIRQNDLFPFSDLKKLQSLSFGGNTFLLNSQLTFTNCPSLKNLKFSECEINGSTNLGIATLPAIVTVEFDRCNIDLATWQSITDTIRYSTVKCLKLTTDFFAKKTYHEYLHHLQKCEHVEKIHVKDILNNTLNCYEEEVSANLAQTAGKLPGLRSIILDADDVFRLKEGNKERIEKAGQERNPDFLIKYLE